MTFFQSFTQKLSFIKKLLPKISDDLFLVIYT